MVALSPGKPVTVATPELLVENPLAAGSYRFQLVVTDDAGNESAPAELVVTVNAPTRTIFTTATTVDRSVLLREALKLRRPL